MFPGHKVIAGSQSFCSYIYIQLGMFSQKNFPSVFKSQKPNKNGTFSILPEKSLSASILLILSDACEY